MTVKSTAEILQRTKDILADAELGLEDFSQDPTRRMSALRNLVVFGRAVTNVLQNLRSTETKFDEWYSVIRAEMESDPMMKFFYNLRSRIIKQGETGVSNFTHIKSFSFPLDMAKFGPPPKNAKDFFIGDNVGGTGWTVEVAPGVIEKYYVDLPAEIGTSGLYFQDAPGSSKAHEIGGKEALELCTKYINRLREIVQLAERQFKR